MSANTFRVSRCSAFLALAAVLLAPFNASALSFDAAVGDSSINGVLNTTITIGGAWRMQNRAADLVGKSNLNPDVCADFQSCQGVFKDQTTPARTLAAAPGQFSLNADDGNLNYDRHDLVSAVAKVTQDLKLSYENFEFFARWLYFYDAVNNNFTEYHPNRVTRENYQQVGFAPGDRGFVNTGDPVTTAILRNLVYFPNNRIYGAGGVVRNRRTDSSTLKQVGTNLQLMEAVLSGKFEIAGERSLNVKLGRQTVNWGESTLLVINSLNQVNPVNANNLYRVGFQLEEVFTPVGMLYASTEIAPGVDLGGFYQLEWQPVEIPAPGSFMSFLDVGTNNAGRNVSISFGGGAEDPSSLARPQNNPLALIAGTSLNIERLRDHTPSHSGQYGASLKYYAEWLGNGTELGAYFMNYHSRLPYGSFYATQNSCARAGGNSQHRDATNALDIVSVVGGNLCPDLPINRVLLGQDPNLAKSSVAPLDTARFQLEYPENIKLYGFSFNTTLGDLSLQGEVAYRPKAPLQIATVDLAFAAFGPTLTRCHDNIGCAGSSNGSIGVDGTTHHPSDFTTDVAGTNNPFRDTIDAGVALPITVELTNTLLALGLDPTQLNLPSAVSLGHIPGSARAFPNFVIPYRGGMIGDNAATDLSRPLNSKNPGYIRGYEYFKTLQYNFGGTYISGASDPLAAIINADQVQSVFEIGATHVPNMPSWSELQIEGPGTYTSATAGADGTGADGSQRACSTNKSCTVGPDGLRFNPTQQRDGFATRFSWGYRIINVIKYESVLPGISIQPTIIFAHDVSGTAPGPAENFVDGRKSIVSFVETRYKSAFSFTLGYTWFTGGGSHNLYRDRDFAQAFAKYQF
ncbi:DUF1302 domain-containing protein [Stenotrophobium rhamnosiphilum]|uniref:DUF1302 domain-containing protein n=1 Tax=Stenotrophobium rhamnosiphilum TaxID=2029166 RepID=A0A2T5ML08_9GAMM|nr:DUF1302 family protein [Stenotrophobium rhamnosiphilum]PTU33244.1 DUF1302 domain-containing protein [Stenotrophobium rhamnosiphilum]